MDQVNFGEQPLKVDRLSTIVRVIVVAGCSGIAMLFFSLAAVGLRDGPDRGGYPGLIAMIAAAIFILGLGWYTFMRRATIWPDRVEYANGFGATSSLLRSSIKGFRHSSKNERLILIPRDEFAKPISVSTGLLKDARTKTWFEGLPDLDAQDLEAAQKELERDARLGATDTERRASIRRMTFAAQIISGAGLVFALWAFVTAWPSNLPVFGAIAVMLSALAAKLIFGSFLTVGGERYDPRPSVATVLLCGVAIGLRGMADNHVLDWMTALEWAGGAALGAALLLIVPDERLRSNLSQVPFVLLALIGFFYGTIIIANRTLDTTRPAIFHTWVDNKYVSSGKSTSYHLVLDNWGDHPGGGTDVAVARSFY